MKSNQNVLSGETVPWTFRLASLPVAYLDYLAKLFWPVDLTIIYPRPTHLGGGLVLLAVAVLAGISLLAIIRLRRAPCLAFGWAWFLGMLVPVIGIVSMSKTFISDRYTYLPAIGLFIAVVWTAAEGLARVKYRNLLLHAAAAVVLAACGYLTWFQIGHWRNGIALWSRVVAVNGDDALADYNIGWTYENLNQPDKAAEFYQAALRLQPDLLDANLNLGIVLTQMGQPRRALDYLHKVLRLKPDYSKAHAMLGWNLFELGDNDGAIQQSTEAFRLDPNLKAAAAWLLKALRAKAASDPALNVYADRFEASPPKADFWLDLGVEWLNRNMDAAAVASFRLAVQDDPASEPARFQLAVALSKTDAVADAIAEYQSLLKLHPDNPAALNNFAWLLATQPEARWRNGAEAVRLAQHACELTTNQEAVCLGTLAAAYAEAGRFDDAAKAAQKAHDVALAAGQKEVADRNEQLMQLYKSGRAFHMDSPPASQTPNP